MDQCFYLHWIEKFKAPKGDQLLDYNCSAYLFGDIYRFCFSCSKQKYYFELKITNEETIKEEATTWFEQNRQECNVAKCIRCSKWTVEEDIFCPRCKEAVKKNEGNTTIDIVI